MTEFVFALGWSVLCIGGVLLTACILLFLGWLLQCAWVAFSVTFRKICKTESLICEYRKNREEFLKWREDKNATD